MKTLIIAEKPSVATDISRALGKFRRVDDFLENDDYVISSAVGHLVELQMPEDIDKKKYGFWRLSELPIMPEKFKVKPIDDKRSKERLNLLKKLMKREDVDLILNACDAGREGELIFTYIYDAAGCKKPFKRVWMQSMTRDAIRAAFESLREPEVMQGLQDAARSRSEADWLIGINGTRAITKRMFGRGKGVATVGRVQTPTLSIVLQRELEIRNFTPQPFWRIVGQFNVTEGDYEGVYQKAAKVDKDANPHDRADRLWNKEDADALLASLEKASFAIAEDQKKRARQAPQRLYDLTTLQREANGRYGLPAGKTLRIAQALYEKYKVLTYPRTDSRALPEDYIPTVRQTLGQLGGSLSAHAKKVLANDWVRPNKRIFNNAQISDHFAIVPTGENADRLTGDEAKIYDMVARRFIAIFYPPAEFDVTTRTTTVADHPFVSEGKVLVVPGYLEVYGKSELDKQIPALVEADKKPSWLDSSAPALPSPKSHFSRPLEINQHEETTKPPSRYTEATLLSAMEGAGKLVEDEELAEAMKEKGLGTPATRAATIDHLLNEKYMDRDGRYLLPTTKAENLFEFLEAIKVETLTHPDLTGEWEHKLLLMEQGKLPRSEFMQGIRDLTKTIVERTRTFEEKEEDATETSIICPTDGKPMLEMLRQYRSQDGKINVYKTIGNRKLSEEEVQTLVKDGRVGPLDDFKSRAGKPFSAILQLNDEGKVSFDFGDSNGGGNGDSEPVDISQLKQIAVFKESGDPVYEAPNAYGTEAGLKGDKKSFRMSRTLLGKTVPPEQITRLLEEGKTELIKGFKSKRTGRLFDAFLILKKGGGIGFEFPPRAPKKSAGKAAKKAATKSASKEKPE